MHMCFKSWLYNSLMLWDEFKEEDKKEEDKKEEDKKEKDCKVSEAWSNNHEDNIQYYFYCWCIYCVWCERQD